VFGKLLIEGEHAFIDVLDHQLRATVIICRQTCTNDPKKSNCTYGMAMEREKT
jgi:hypothetical protein